MTQKKAQAQEKYDAMVATRKRVSRHKRDRIIAVVEEMQQKGIPVTFAEVGRRADASTYLLYQPGIKEIIAEARGTPVGGPSGDSGEQS